MLYHFIRKSRQLRLFSLPNWQSPPLGSKFPLILDPRHPSLHTQDPVSSSHDAVPSLLQYSHPKKMHRIEATAMHIKPLT